MLRRRALSLLLTSAARLHSRPLGTLDRFLDAKRGCALLIDVQSGKILATNSNPLANTILAPPGSTMKPFVLYALLRSGKLRSDESFFCPERLLLAGHRVDCSHPRLATPMHIDTALAYSCKLFFRRPRRRAFRARVNWRECLMCQATSNRSDRPRSSESAEPSALPVFFLRLRPWRWRWLGESSHCIRRDPKFWPLTRRRRRVWHRSARPRALGDSGGQDGKCPRRPKLHRAWFAGFLPSRAPQLVITVMLSRAPWRI